MLRFDGVQKAGEGVGELPAVVGVHPSPEAGISISSKCPRGYVCQSMYLHCLGEKQVLKGCVVPLRGGTPVLIPGVGPGSELGPLQGNPSTQLSSLSGRVKAFQMPGATQTVTVLLGSLLWLEMVRPGIARAGSKVGNGARRLRALSLSQSCRSEDWTLPAGGEHAKGHL